MLTSHHTPNATHLSRISALLDEGIEPFLTTRTVLVARPDALISEGCEGLAAEPGSVLLVVAQDTVVGLVDASDIVAAIARGNDPATRPLADIMTYRPSTLDINATIGDALSVMASRGVDNLPVTKCQRVVGTLALRDIPACYLWAHDLATEYVLFDETGT